MIVGAEDEEGALPEDALFWARFARKFLAADAYRYGARVADTLGVDGASAVAITLRRLSERLGAKDAFACVEAASILCGEVEEIEALNARW